ncbi:hypothetical protein LCGC14_2368260 [marine sediment metagenome]|uniref:Uncharacterized protein n=1 Tax=marine sediment metagenome TaxID=412755 RepID=A0A0F9CRT2_9ZZZZ
MRAAAINSTATARYVIRPIRLCLKPKKLISGTGEKKVLSASHVRKAPNNRAVHPVGRRKLPLAAVCKAIIPRATTARSRRKLTFGCISELREVK